jgi:penicillin amidase
VRRLLLAVNVLIAIALIAAIVIFYWVFYRALPQTSGTIRTLVTEPVQVDRDRLGVPHIKARSLEDAWFVQGYVTAEDRMWQMDTLRRAAGGDLAAIIGAGGLESDHEARRMRLRRIAEQVYTETPPEDKVILDAYARGVNAYIESHRGRYGFEFVALQYDPRPWSVIDSLLAGLQMYRTLTNDYRTKLVKQQMLTSGEADKVNFLFGPRGGGEFIPGGDVQAGSNAWAVSGAHSADGKPLLSNDMHLEFSLPGVWYMTHIEAPGLNVSGVALPGLPGIISGHNDRIAWGLTNMEASVQDLYREKIDLRTGQYVFQNKPEQARADRDVIPIKGRPTEETTNWSTLHGPIVVEQDGAVYTLRWTAAEPGGLRNTFPDLDRARNWDEFKQVLSRFGGPPQNFVYADVDGNIGYHGAGRIPIRKTFAGDVPLDGASGQNEWEGYIPFDQLPQNFNPPDGFIVTANQNPFPAHYSYSISGGFAAPYRSIQILDMLKAAGNKIRPEDNLRIQKDVYAGFDRFLAQQIVAAYQGRTAVQGPLSDAIAMLRGWNGQMDKDRAEPLIVQLVFQHLRRSIADRASPGNGALYSEPLSSAIIERLLRERPAGWFSDYSGLLVQAFADGIEEGQRLQGADPKLWKWGRYMFLAVNHPIGGRLPWVRTFFDIGPAPLSGSSLTVKQTTQRLGPSERMDTSLGNWDHSLLNLPFGESGHVASPHYKDEWDAYYNGRSFPMQFKNVDARSTVTFVPVKPEVSQ